MIDYDIQPRIPKAVVQYANMNCEIPKSNNILAKQLEYYTIWNDQEVYTVSYIYKLPYTHPEYGQGSEHVTSHFILYNCNEVYSAPIEMGAELEWYKIKHFNSFSEQYHVCTSD